MALRLCEIVTVICEGVCCHVCLCVCVWGGGGWEWWAALRLFREQNVRALPRTVPGPARFGPGFRPAPLSGDSSWLGMVPLVPRAYITVTGAGSWPWLGEEVSVFPAPALRHEQLLASLASPVPQRRWLLEADPGLHRLHHTWPSLQLHRVQLL